MENIDYHENCALFHVCSLFSESIFHKQEEDTDSNKYVPAAREQGAGVIYLY